MLRLPYPANVNLEELGKQRPAVAGWWSYHGILEERIFGSRDVFQVKKQDEEDAQLRAGEAVMPDLLAGRYDAWLTPSTREQLRVQLGKRDSRMFRVSVVEAERLGLLEYRTPEYPPLAIERRIAGTVRLEVQANRDDGKVRDVRVVVGYPLFLRSAVAAVRDWRFDPARMAGSSQPLSVELRYGFCVSPE